MKKSGTIDLPLHTGKCPRWLFGRMKKLAKGISEVIIEEYGQEELLKRLANPYFFQALGCTLAFDWHSSGLTTVTTGALKEAINPEESGILVAGGKGNASRNTLNEIEEVEFNLSDKVRERLQYGSRISAKVDNSCVQDSYNLYHHCFVFSEKGDWCVIQQGMGENYARRYHWLSDQVEEFIEEPHEGICCDKKEKEVLNLTSSVSKETRKVSVDLIKDNPQHLGKYLQKKNQLTLTEFTEGKPKLENRAKDKSYRMPSRHALMEMDIGPSGMKTLQRAYEFQPENYEELISLKGMGPKKIRALALISELVYGTENSWKDPAKFSFSHGGKDGFPYPVDIETYENSIEVLKEGLEKAQVGRKEKLYAVKRLKEFL